MKKNILLSGLVALLAVFSGCEMYEAMDPREYETQRMRRVFQREKPRSELDAKLIDASISAIMVDSNGNVKIRLKNDQTIERGEKSE